MVTKLGPYVVAVSLLAGCSTSEPDGPVERTAYARVGGDVPYRLLDLGLDSATYEEMVGGRGATGVRDLGPSTERRVELRIDSSAPPILYEALLAPDPDLQRIALLTPDFSILLGGGSGGGSTAIGLLLPAVQKATDVTIEQDGTFVIGVSGIGDIAPIDEEELAAAGGVNVAAGDINGFVGGNGTNVPIGEGIGFRLAAPASFSRSGAAYRANDRLRTAGPKDGWPSWFDPMLPTWASVDVQRPGGPIVHRFRVEPVIATDEGDAFVLGPIGAPARYLKIEPIAGATRDGVAERAMFGTRYPTYVGRPFLLASDALARFRDLGPASGAPSQLEVQTYWQDRATIVDALYAAVAHAAEHHALVCQVALPVTLTAAKAMESSVNTGVLSADPSRALADVFEALRSAPSPTAGAHAVALEMTAVAGASAAKVVGLPCQALGSVAAFRDALASATGVPNAAADMLIRIATIPASAHDLDRALVDWVESLDAITASSDDTSTQRAAAKTKADILIDSLITHDAASAARWALAEEIAGP